MIGQSKQNKNSDMDSPGFFRIQRIQFMAGIRTYVLYDVMCQSITFYGCLKTSMHLYQI